MFTKQQFLEYFSLFFSGLLLLVIGASITLTPDTFFAMNGIELHESISLKSELRAPAGFLLVTGVLLISALWSKSLRSTALLIASLVYLSYGAARLIGIAVDGIPAQGLIEATVIELVAGSLCLWSYWGRVSASSPVSSLEQAEPEDVMLTR